MSSADLEGTSETAPLRASNTSVPYVPMETASRTFGSLYFLISTLIAAIIPIVQLGIGVYYKGQCPVDQRISLYMVVAGACGLVLVGLSVLLNLTFLCFISKSTALTVLASCGVCLNLVLTCLLSIFVLIWFILGCVWVFSAKKYVQFYDSSKPDYCQPVLYKSAFGLIIASFILCGIYCCVSCFRQCCVGRSE